MLNRSFFFLGLRLLVTCTPESSDPALVSLQGSEVVEQVHTIEIEESDSLVIGQFESIDVNLDPFRMYIADRELHRVAVVNRDGEIIRSIGEPGQGPGELQNPQRAVRRGDSIIVEDTDAQLSVFTAEGDFLRRERLPEGMWRGGMWSLSESDDGLYLAIQDVDSRAEGLQATKEEDVIAKIDDNFDVVERFGTYPDLYQQNEYVWRYTTLDVNDGRAAVGYYLVPEVQIYDLTQTKQPLVETVELEHPKFTAPDEPLPMGMPREELRKHATNLSFVWQTFLLSDSTVVQVFNNRTEEFYDNQAEEERQHYATLGKVGSDEQLALELPGRVFARDDKDRLYVELNPVPDERQIGIYEVRWP